MPQSRGPVTELFQLLKSGRITRREFIARAAALGVGASLTLLALNSVHSRGASATDVPSGRPSFGTEGQKRGAGGELRIRQWQAPSGANVHVATGANDGLAASPVTEPLISYAADGSLVPTLVTEVPSLENGGLSEDLTTVTYNLLPGVVWSDGAPFTADDVVWTWQWIMDETNGAFDAYLYERISGVEPISSTQVRVIFNAPSLNWFDQFSGTYTGGILPKHLWEAQEREKANEAFLTNSIGTGPYKVESFVPNDQVLYSINENYREPNKPWFSSVLVKGGGDHLTAAQAVLETGDWDLAWNLAADVPALRQLEVNGKGTIEISIPTLVERIEFNFSDPNAEVAGERSSVKEPNPILTDRAVRQAMALAIDRAAISNEFYMGEELEPPARNILTGIEALESPNTTWVYDVDRANQILDEAGWVRNEVGRSKDGTELRVSFETMKSPFTPPRESTQDRVRQAWEEIGIKVQAGQIDYEQFFNYDPANEYSYVHFYRDAALLRASPISPFPLDYMMSWYAGPANSNVAQQSNDWFGPNVQRYVNPAYDALFDEVSTTTDADRAAELFIQMNDIVVNDIVVIPLVAQADQKYAISNRLEKENVAASNWELLYWNIANWRTVEG
jgi:peptide/nickel transport system substrate-binding protein